MFRLDNLTENEIKELDKGVLNGIIEVYKDYMMIIQPQDADKMIELKNFKSHKSTWDVLFSKREYEA